MLQFESLRRKHRLKQVQYQLYHMMYFFVATGYNAVVNTS